MQRWMLALAAVSVAGLALAQETGRYKPSQNPFQGEFPFGPGRLVELLADVEGVRLDGVTVNPQEEVRPGQQIRCEVQVTGNSVAKKKASLTTVLLLEDAGGKGIQRVQLTPFKVKAGRPFDERQTLPVAGDTLSSAMKVYVFIKIDF